VDSAGRVYVSDKGNNNIQVFAPAWRVNQESGLPNAVVEKVFSNLVH
jgi:hypothetical protein